MLHVIESFLIDVVIIRVLARPERFVIWKLHVMVANLIHVDQLTLILHESPQLGAFFQLRADLQELESFAPQLTMHKFTIVLVSIEHERALHQYIN